MITINTDEAAELAIQAKVKRSFDITVNLKAATTGKTYKMEVRGTGPDPVLSFMPGSGLTIDGMAIKLKKTPAQMDIPTGAYNYDLVEITTADGTVENVFYGPFIALPSYTIV